ncbi:MAG TPA: PAS domain S-box protein, partial [Armatimonadota bacterium]|nr:PAS domain S-box protein [Armatimonadota bacterium]
MTNIPVLLLEDSALDADLISVRLSAGQLQYAVDRVETRAEFVAALEAKPYELILADYQLPSFSGAAALKIAREMCPHTPFIFVSGTLGEEVAVDTLKQGATDYVVKHRLDRLIPAVERALSDSRERAALRAAQEALRLSEERYRSLVAATSSIVWTVDATGAFVTPQPSWEAYTGQPWDEHCGFGWTEAVHPDDRAALLACWERARDQRSLYQGEGRLWHGPSGAYRHFAVRATCVEEADGSVREWIGTCTDTENERRAEEALRKSEQQFRLLMEQAADAIFIADFDGAFTAVNESAC